MSASDFKALRDDELAKRSDDELIDYMRRAQAAGAHEAGRRALAVLVWGYSANVHRKMSMRLPRHAVEDAAQEAIVRAISSAFAGESPLQFRAWLSTICNRQVADYYRNRKRRPDAQPLPEPGADPEDEGLVREPSVEAEDGAVETQIVVDEVMAGMSEQHRRVIDLHVFAGLSAQEVCEHVDGMQPDNVAQIASRFRKRLRERLEGEDSP